MNTPAGNTDPIGVCLRPEYDEYALGKLADYARLADANGFHSVWLAESWGMDAIALLGHIGAHTQRVKLGTAIINVFSRTPALLSMAAVTLNDLYGGRFILGLGTSTKALVEDWHGMSYQQPVTRLRETVNIVRQLIAGNEVNYEGTAVSVQGLPDPREAAVCAAADLPRSARRGKHACRGRGRRRLDPVSAAVARTPRIGRGDPRRFARGGPFRGRCSASHRSC